MSDDVDVEANWYDELAGTLESAPRELRRAAGLLRLAGGVLPASELAVVRAELAGVLRRTVDAMGVTLELIEHQQNEKGSVAK
jgi:hypothetical protein